MKTVTPYGLTPPSECVRYAFACALAGFIAAISQAHALTIVRDYIGGTPGTNSIGSGSLVEIFNAAADIWEDAILDEHTVVLHYGWSPVGGGVHILNAQGGTPNRETEGTILFNNDDITGHFLWFLDATPRLSEEFSLYREAYQDPGSGVLNVTRVFRHRFGYETSPDKTDLFSAALHEIGHALGMSMDNLAYISETADGKIDVLAPLPFAGMSIPVQTNLAHLANEVGQTAVMSGWAASDRPMPSAVDILALAQLSGFRKINLNLSPELHLTRLGNEGLLTWEEPIPGFNLEHSEHVGSAGSWGEALESVFPTNWLCAAIVSPTNASDFYRLRRTNEFALMLSRVYQEPEDVAPLTPGTQAFAGSTVSYSVTSTNATSETVWWHWMYSVNGGADQGFEMGSGPVPAREITYPADQAGNVYRWMITVSTGEMDASAYLDVLLVPPL